MLNEEGWSQDNGTGSARDYFIDSSNGKFTPTFDVFGPVLLDHDHSYYGGNNLWGSDQRAYEMAIEACQKLDDEVDFSLYDGDEDGYIDMVYVIYAGYGEADGGGADTVWPHSWDLSSAGATGYVFDGKTLEHYACGNEIQLGDVPDGIGTFVHEFSHVLGLPDLYATSYTSAFTPEYYSVLDRGCYCNDSHTPPTYGIFERTALGWAEVEILDEFSEYSLEHILTSNKGFKLPTSKATEYFLFENRQLEGWDAYMEGHGMLVWHIDYNSSVWSSNRVNNTPSHQYVDIEEADDIQSMDTADGDPFPGASDVHSITDRTSPNLLTWNGERTHFPLNNIQEEDGIITFIGGVDPDNKPAAPEALEADDITYRYFRAHWTLVDMAEEYWIRVTREDGTPLSQYNPHKVTDSTVDNYLVTNLQAETTYYYTVTAVIDNIESEPSNTVEVSTLPTPINAMTLEALEASDITANSFVANWQPLSTAIDYVLNVTMEGEVENPMFALDFTDGVKNLPEGWSSTSTYSYSTGENSGATPPSLRFSSAGNIASCAYSGQIQVVSFWYRGVNTNEENSISLQVTDGTKWDTIATFHPSNDEGQTAFIANIPEGYNRMRLLYEEKQHKGSIAIDDIVILTDGTYDGESVVGDYLNLSVGDVSSLKIEGLRPLTTYHYRLIATDGELWSKPSSIITVKTSDDAGIAGILSDNASITVEGNCIMGKDLRAYTVDGRLVGAGDEITLAPGLYIVIAQGHAQKITIR